MPSDTPPENNKTLAEINWDEKNQPVSAVFQDVYFSRENGLEESRHVFCEQNNLVERWQVLSAEQLFTVAETGFGSGLNFLVAWQQWSKLCESYPHLRTCQLHFISAEKYPLQRSDLKKILALWPQLHTFAGQLIDAYPPQPATGVHRLQFNQGKIKLTLVFSDAAEGFKQLAPCASDGHTAPANFCFADKPVVVDAWFLDGFAPAKNPQMWSEELFSAIARLSSANTSLATFTAAGAVKRGLQTAGFSVQKVPGYGRKREMLRATFGSLPEYRQQNSEPEVKPIPHTKRGKPARLYWHLQEAQQQTSDKTVMIIGGGLAGCQAANALAQRNYKVTLLEKNAVLAQEASGNRQGIVYTRLSPHLDPLSRFNLAAQVFANHFYHQPLAEHTPSLFEACGQACGVVHLASNEKQHTYYQKIAEQFASEPDFCQWLERDTLSEHCGVNVKHPGLRINKAGWLAPAELCNKLCEHGNIELRFNTHVKELLMDDGSWQLLDAAGEVIAQAPRVIIANAAAATELAQTAHLPLNRIRGQVSHLPQAAEIAEPLGGLSCVICGEGYVAPAQQNRFCVGATFTLNNHNADMSAHCHQTNLHNLHSMIASEQSNDISQLGGRVAFRTSTRDYFPVVGPVADVSQTLRRFERLRVKANDSIDLPACALPGLYCLLGLGSRGLAYSPLAAELLASLINAEPLPVTQSLYQHLHPARFLIRDLIRNKP